ncbi:MAG: phytoene/squalene synthase family protein [Myxococcota bacterium]
MPRSSDQEACLAILARGSKSFALAGRLLPRRVLEPTAALYAFCRVSDDRIDEAPRPAAGLAEVMRRIELLYAGRPADDPVDRAFAQVIETHRLPRPVLEALAEGFLWDVERRRYRDLDALVDYAARVASTVGVLLTLILGERRPSMLARAADLGVAMQLTNIARDVGEDARNGRLYLPIDSMRQAGLDPERFLAEPRFSPALGAVVEGVLDAAEPLYQRAELGLVGLPRSVRFGLGAAGAFYRGIGARIRRARLDTVSTRRWVPLGTKLWLASTALPLLFRSGDGGTAPALRQTQFLVEASRG